MKIQAPKPTKDEYVDECFRFDFEEEVEYRNWRTIPDFVSIPTYAKGSLMDAGFALKKIEGSLAAYSDYHFLYIWMGYIYSNAMNWESKARDAYEAGLKACRSKVSLLDQLGQWHHDNGSLSNAIMFWIKSCAVQSSTQHFEHAHPYMMLYYIAWKLKMRKEENSLGKQYTKIDNIALNSTGEAILMRKIETLKSDHKKMKSVKKAIQTLCKFYRVGK